MADTTHPITAAPGAKRIDPHEVGTGVTRRDFLIIATGAFAAVGVGGHALALHRPDEPDAAALALASIEVDISSIEAGQSITVDVARQAGLHPLPHRGRDQGGEAGLARRA